MAGRRPTLRHPPLRRRVGRPPRLSSPGLEPAVFRCAQQGSGRALARRPRVGQAAVLERRPVRAHGAGAPLRDRRLGQRRLARRLRRAVRAVPLLGARDRGRRSRRPRYARPGVRGGDGSHRAPLERQLLHSRGAGARGGADGPRGNTRHPVRALGPRGGAVGLSRRGTAPVRLAPGPHAPYGARPGGRVRGIPARRAGGADSPAPGGGRRTPRRRATRRARAFPVRGRPEADGRTAGGAQALARPRRRRRGGRPGAHRPPAEPRRPRTPGRRAARSAGPGALARGRPWGERQPRGARAAGDGAPHALRPGRTRQARGARRADTG